MVTFYSMISEAICERTEALWEEFLQDPEGTAVTQGYGEYMKKYNPFIT